MRLPSSPARLLALGMLAIVLTLGMAPGVLAEEGAEEPTPEQISAEPDAEQGDSNNFTGTYQIAGSTGKGNKFAAVVHIWDLGTEATVRGVVPQLGRAMSWTFPVKQLSDNEYQISGAVGVPFVLNASGSATITKKGAGYELGGAGNGSFLGKEGSATFGGSRTSATTDGQVSTVLIDKQGNETTTDAEGNKTIIKAPAAVVDPLAPEPEAEMPPVSEDTKAQLVGLLSAIIATQLIMEVISGGKISKGDLKDSISAAHEAVASESSSSMADASDYVGDISSSASEGGGE